MESSSQQNIQHKLSHHGHVINKNIIPNASIIINLFERSFIPSENSHDGNKHQKIKYMKNILKRSLKIEFGNSKRNKNENFLSNSVEENLNIAPCDIQKKNLSKTNVSPKEIISQDNMTKFNNKNRGRPLKFRNTKIKQKI